MTQSDNRNILTQIYFDSPWKDQEGKEILAPNPYVDEIEGCCPPPLGHRSFGIDLTQGSGNR